MSSDYKWDVQVIADDLAEAKYDKTFYQLTQEQQYEVYSMAMVQHRERFFGLVDYLRKAERENER